MARLSAALAAAVLFLSRGSGVCALRDTARTYAERFFATFLDAALPLQILDVGGGPDGNALAGVAAAGDTSWNVTTVSPIATAGADAVSLDGGHKLPFGDEAFDVVTSNGVLDGDPFFWSSVVEMCRVVRVGGLVYVSAPADAPHRGSPTDAWRFGADGGAALAAWARREGCELRLARSFLGDRFEHEAGHDLIIVFLRGSAEAAGALARERPFDASLQNGVPPPSAPACASLPYVPGPTRDGLDGGHCERTAASVTAAEDCCFVDLEVANDDGGRDLTTLRYARTDDFAATALAFLEREIPGFPQYAPQIAASMAERAAVFSVAEANRWAPRTGGAYVVASDDGQWARPSPGQRRALEAGCAIAAATRENLERGCYRVKPPDRREDACAIRDKDPPYAWRAARRLPLAPKPEIEKPYPYVAPCTEKPQGSRIFIMT